MILAIHQSSSVVFEGFGNKFSAIDPIPYFSKFFVDKTDLGKIDPLQKLFREDSFDSTTRIRRGRFYQIDGLQRPGMILVNFGRFPPPGQTTPSQGVFINIHAMDFGFYNNLTNINSKRIFFGDSCHSTAWRIVDAERLFNGETLFTLKSMSALGILPELIEEKLPAEKRKEVQEGFEKVVDVAPIQIAESVVDVCREYARLLLAAWLPTVDVTGVTGDLGGLVSKVPQERNGIANAASVINRLHPRGKSSERERQAEKKQEVRPLSDGDASLAVSLIGFLLRDFGWAA